MAVFAPTSGLVGRARELALIEAQLTETRRGDGRSLMFTGEPGSGKTALLDAARRLAADCLVVSCRGVQWESELPFSGLHELLGPLLGELPALPVPQREGLQAALGLAPADGLHTLNVYAGALSLLVEATRTRPVLVIVDDLQWIDGPTLQVLSFVARRIGSEPLSMLIGSRPGASLPGLPAQPVELSGLDDAAVADLAALHLDRRLPPASVADLTAASAGNPLAIVESLRHVGEKLWLRGSELDEPLPVSALIERGFSERLGALSPLAREAVEVAATSVTADATVITAALDGLGAGAAGLVEAEEAGFVVLGGSRVEFAHPLLRALAHQRTEPGRQRRIHEALAAVTPDPSLAAWHAGGAATVADDRVAADLEAAADRFLSRGGHLSAAKALARAAELTADLDGRAERLISAGRSAYHAGRGSWATELYAEAVTTAVDPKIRVRGAFEQVRSDASLVAAQDPATRFLAVSDAALGIDDSLAAWAACSAAIEGVIAGHLRPTMEAVERLTALRDAADLSDESAREVEAVLGVVLVITGRDAEGEGHALLRTAGERRIHTDQGNHEFVAEALVWVEEFELAARLSAQLIDRVRAQGDVYTLTGSLWADAYRCYRTGDWARATANLSEGIRLSESIDLQMDVALSTATLAIVQASQGDESFRDSVPLIEERAREFGFGIIEEYTGTALGLAALGAGRAAEAAGHFERVRRRMNEAGQVEPCVLSWPADLVEAYLAAGEPERAREALEELRTRTQVARRPWACAAVARLDGLLAPDEDYDRHFEEALALYARTQAPFDLARTRLSFGQRLRRSKRRVEARDHLAAALEAFEHLGAEPWAKQARRELGASAPTLRRGLDADSEALTPQEAQVAELVAAGASNKEVAGNMFLSPKTIETHLSRIYRKLGVSSRTQLAVRMRGEVDTEG